MTDEFCTEFSHSSSYFSLFFTIIFFSGKIPLSLQVLARKALTQGQERAPDDDSGSAKGELGTPRGTLAHRKRELLYLMTTKYGIIYVKVDGK